MPTEPDPDVLWRPDVHFSPARHFMNDPNGLVHHRGVHHLFFQYNAEGDVAANASWGHATSDDLVHWTEQAVAMAADDVHEVWSGSVVLDREDTSGLGRDGTPPLVAVHTHRDRASGVQSQAIASSTDDGATWTPYDANPVLDLDSQDFRDPKVFRDEERSRWVMVVALSVERQVVLYSSTDLLSWTELSRFGPAGAAPGVWECPDLFALSTPDGERHWVLTLSVTGAGQYFVGDFDGERFTTTEAAPRWLDHGPDFYAAVTFNDLPDDRRVMVGWMSSWDYAQVVPTSPWRGSQSVARELTLDVVEGRPTLLQRPVAELVDARGRASRFAGRVDGSRDTGLHGATLDLDVAVRPTATVTAYGVEVRAGEGQATRIGHDVVAGELVLDRTRSGRSDFSEVFARAYRAPVDPGVDLRVVLDRGSVEVFTADGRVAMTATIFPGSGDRVVAWSEGGACDVEVRSRPLR